MRAFGPTMTILLATLSLVAPASATDPTIMFATEAEQTGGLYGLGHDACGTSAVEGITSNCAALDADYEDHLWGAYTTSATLREDVGLRVCFHDAVATRIACYSQGDTSEPGLFNDPWGPVPPGSAMVSVSSYVGVQLAWRLVITSDIAGQ